MWYNIIRWARVLELADRHVWGACVSDVRVPVPFRAPKTKRGYPIGYPLFCFLNRDLNPKRAGGEAKRSGGAFCRRRLRRRVPNAKRWVVKQCGLRSKPRPVSRTKRTATPNRCRCSFFVLEAAWFEASSASGLEHGANLQDEDRKRCRGTRVKVKWAKSRFTHG